MEEVLSASSTALLIKRIGRGPTQSLASPDLSRHQTLQFVALKYLSLKKETGIKKKRREWISIFLKVNFNHCYSMLKNEFFNPFYESGFRNSSLIVMRLWEKLPDSELGETTPPKHSTARLSS